MSVILNEKNFTDYNDWIQILSNIIKLDMSHDNFEFQEHESVCSIYYNDFFVSTRQKFRELYINNESYLRDENFLKIIICIFKNNLPKKILEREFLFKIFEFIYANFDKSSYYNNIFDALITALEYESLGEEELMNFYNSSVEKSTSIVTRYSSIN